LRVRLRLPLDRFELDVDFATHHEATGIFGPSGSGKTSLLEAIAGVRKEARGCVDLGGEVWTDTAARIFRRPERRQVGYVPQDGLLFPHLDVRGNLLAGSRRARRSGGTVEETLATVAELLELGPLLDRRPGTLSGGERQRVALGRAICSGPRLLLLDEPFASLDLPLRRRLLPFLLRVRNQLGIPMLLVSHDPTEVQVLCDDLIVLRRGAVVARGDPRDVLTDPEVFPLAEEQGFQNALLGEVIESDEETSLVCLSAELPELRLLTPRAAAQHDLLVTIPANDILIATARPTQLSAQNVLPARIEEIRPVGGKRLVITRLAADVPPLAVEVTVRACQGLDLRPGRDIFLIIKTAACRLYAGGA
ncbi:MAG: molybdenum ABC transporter ATP-binding protein, partial [bacterium]|nr:molybdenum ABC transporter ATP-binding protein [bacterium]